MTNYHLDSKSYIYIHTVDGKMSCSGVLRVTHLPYFGVGCDEEEGSVVMDCDNNDRVIVSNWTSTNCSEGYGHGFTDHGAVIDFVFFPITQTRYCAPH